jgi:hypothetical protein
MPGAYIFLGNTDESIITRMHLAYQAELPKRKWSHNFRVNHLCSLGQWLSKCGCMTVFGAHSIEKFAERLNHHFDKSRVCNEHQSMIYKCHSSQCPATSADTS